MSSRPEPVAILLESLPRKDFERLKGVLDPGVRFRALAPGESVDVGSADEAVGVFRKWFGDKDELELVLSEAEPLVDRIQLRYRLRLRRNGEPFLVEHRLCGDVENGRFVSLDLLCSGFRPCGPAPGAGSVHRFEAGELGAGPGCRASSALASARSRSDTSWKSSPATRRRGRTCLPWPACSGTGWWRWTPARTERSRFAWRE